jgi:hypothetical protein
MKNWSKIALVLGPMIMIALDYTRLEPDYNFLIQPWSWRGYETRHARAILAIGAVVVIGGLLSAWEGFIRPAVSAGVKMYLVAAATGVAALFTTGTDRAVTNITPETVSGLMVSAMLAVSVSASLRSMFRDKSVVFKRADSGLGLKPISETGSKRQQKRRNVDRKSYDRKSNGSQILGSQSAML